MKSKKARFLLIVLVVLFVLGTVVLFEMNKNFLLLWNTNHIYVETEKPLSQEKVKIKFGHSSINRKTDEELFPDFDDGGILLFDGRRTRNEMPNEYGENDFLVTYDDKLYFSFRQFKFNRRDQHDYYFKFHDRDDGIFMEVDIKGLDEMRFEEEMLAISQAGQYRGNTPIDDTKILFDGVKLKPRK